MMLREIDQAVRRLIAVAVLTIPGPLLAQDYQVSEDAAPESAADLGESLGSLTQFEKPERRVVFEAIDEWRRLKGDFLRDSHIVYNFRSYYFEKKGQSQDPAAWAAGGELQYRSGRWRDFLSLGASWYGSFKLSGNSTSGETWLLDPDGDDLSVIGQAYVQLDWKGFGGRFYRQEIDLPYINRFDIRMLPNTFEAYVVGYKSSEFAAGIYQVDKIKRLNDDSFISMSEAAGVAGSDNGTTVAAFRWGGDDTPASLGMTNQWTRDLFNTFYAEGHITPSIGRKFGLKLSGQYTNQQSSGRNLVGDFDTHAWGTRLAGSYGSFIVGAAFTQTDENSTITSPYGGKPSYTSMMIRDFDRANEKAWRAGFSYYFNSLGLQDVSAQFDVVKGSDALDPSTGAPLADQSEYNYTLDYKPGSGPLEGLWLRARYAQVREDGRGKVDDQLRIIINYSIPFL